MIDGADCLSEELVLSQYSKRVSKNLDVAAYTVAKHIMQDVTFASSKLEIISSLKNVAYAPPVRDFLGLYL